MIRLIAFALLFILSFVNVHSQKVNGFVFDSESKTGLKHVNVFADDGIFGIVTDSLGYFSVERNYLGSSEISVGHLRLSI